MTRHKYNAKRTVVDGITFDSKAEARRYGELKIMERAGEIADLVLQPAFELQEGYCVNGRKVRPITYRADFEYTDTRTGSTVVEDVKGAETPEFKLKRKLFEYRFDGVDFRVVR